MRRASESQEIQKSPKLTVYCLNLFFKKRQSNAHKTKAYEMGTSQ